jgi:AhpD family alkylhydroperoxidase
VGHIAPRELGDLPELQPMLEAVRAAMGFVPNSMLTMAHLPQLPVAFSMLAGVVFGGDLRQQLAGMASLVPARADPEQNLSPELVQLVALAVSTAAGCRYCQAHTSHGAHHRGVPDAKVASILEFEQSEHFSPAERAALRLAFAAGRVPNEAEAAHFTGLRAYYNERQIVQLVSVIALFGFLNRWNDTMATALEGAPRQYAEETLAPLAWDVGKHAPAG